MPLKEYNLQGIPSQQFFTLMNAIRNQAVHHSCRLPDFLSGIIFSAGSLSLQFSRLIFVVF
jgi:hypothetical protein